jgi:hypothetical protein
VKNGIICIWRILADFLIRSGGLEKNHLATLTLSIFIFSFSGLVKKSNTLANVDSLSTQ